MELGFILRHQLANSNNNNIQNVYSAIASEVE